MVYGETWLQLSDFHLGAAEDFRMNGRHVRRRAEALLPLMQRAENLLLTGDLSEDGSEASYAFLLRLLQQTDARVWALAGNHDDPECLQRVLGGRLEPGPCIDLPGWRLLLLDSSCGQVASQALERLTEAADAAPALAVFLHHHPLPCGSAWMDRYLLHQPERLLDWLDARPRLKVVGFGHVHQSLVMQRKGVAYVACPASAYAVQPLTDAFTLLDAPPAGRWWQFLPDGRFRTVLETAGTGC